MGYWDLIQGTGARFMSPREEERHRRLGFREAGLGTPVSDERHGDGFHSGGIGGNSEYCGKPSVIWNQGAFEATCQCASARIPGSSSRVPSGRLKIVGYWSEKAMSGEPQLRQKVRCAPGEEV